MSFRASRFKALYESLKPVDKIYELLEAMDSIIKCFCRERGLASKCAVEFYNALVREAVKDPEELLGEVPSAAQRVWTSILLLAQGQAGGSLEFCSLVNALLRQDHEGAMPWVVRYVRAVNLLCVVRGVRESTKLPFPEDGVLWRGGGLPDEHRAFFAPGVQYRVPGFLATSTSRDVTYNFYYRAYDQGLPAVLWRVKLDPRGATDLRFRCKHVNLVTKSHLGDAEAEFLFAPYSVFEVEAVQWSARPDDDNPHQITVRAAIDNRKESEDLPLAPWY